jgi:hypothetical protein
VLRWLPCDTIFRQRYPRPRAWHRHSRARRARVYLPPSENHFQPRRGIYDLYYPKVALSPAVVGVTMIEGCSSSAEALRLDRVFMSAYKVFHVKTKDHLLQFDFPMRYFL